MRKKITMLLAALFLTLGTVWAQVPYTVSATTGTANQTGFFKTWTYTKSAEKLAGLTLTVGANNMKIDNGQLQLWVGSGSIYTLTVPSSYKIVSYSFDFVKVSDYSDAVKLIVGETEYTPTFQSQKLVVNDVNASSTSFKFTGANKGIVVTNFVVNIDYADCSIAGERKSTFAVGDEMFIYSTCRVNNGADYTGFFTNSNNRASLIKKKPTDLFTKGNDAIWVVASLEELKTEEDTPKTYYKVTLKNKATNGYLGIGGATNNSSAGNAQIFYISQWNNAVFPNGGEKAGNDVRSEDVDGDVLEQSAIGGTDPIWAVAAATGKCFNTNGGAYQGDNAVAYPIVFYTVKSGAELFANAVSATKTTITTAESLLSTVGTPIALQVTNENAAGYIKCNNLHSSEGYNMNWLIDNDPTTYIHSNYSQVSSSNDYLEVYLGEGNGMSKFYFTERSRLNVANDYPSTIEVLGSTDGVTYNPVATVSGLPQQGGKSYTSPLIECDPSYVYLRFVVTTGTNRIYFHMAEFGLYKASPDAVQQRRWGLYSWLSNKTQDAKCAFVTLDYYAMVSANASIDFDVLTASINTTYPFEITTDDNSPICYAIRSGRGDAYWYTYDTTDGKIKLESLKYDNTQYWYFKETSKDDKVYLQLYPLAGEGKAMSYNDTSDGAGKVVAQVVGTGNYRSNWLLEVSNGVYGLQTENKENRLSNHGGTTNKMGFYGEKKPDGDGGTAFTWKRIMKEGLYRFTCVAPKTANNGDTNYNTLTYNGGNNLVTAPADAADLNQLFYAEPTGVNNTFYLYVPEADKYLSKINAGGYRANLVKTKDEACKVELIAYDGVVGQYKLHNSESDALHCLFAENHPTEAIPYACAGWDDGANSPSAWTLVEVSNPYIITLEEAISDALGYMPYFEQGRYTSTMDNVAEKFAGIVEWDAEGKPLPEIVAKIAEVENIIASFEIHSPEAGFYYFYNEGKYLSDDRKSDGATERVLTTDRSAKNIFYYDGQALMSYTSGFGFEFGICNTRTPEKMNYFEFGMAYELGMYTVKSSVGTSTPNYADGYWKNNNGALQRVDAANASGWDIQPVDKLPVTIGSLLHATFYAPVAVNIPKGVKAYTGVVNDVWLTLTEVTDVIPAGTAVVLIAEKAGTYDMVIVESDKRFEGTSHFLGTAPTIVNDKKNAEDKYYTLQTHDFDGDGTKSVAFKKFTGDNLNGFKTYLALPAGTKATALRIRYAGTTEIEETLADGEQEMVIYDLAGRRIEKIVEKGIYIVNGKKVVIR